MSVYVPPATGGPSTGGSATGSSAQTEYGQRYTYLGSYFNAHMLSYPSHRYAYIMYFVFVGILLVASAMHHLGIGDQSWLGAFWAKFAPKSRLFKLGKPPPPPPSDRPSRLDSKSAPTEQRRRKFRVSVPFMNSRYVFSFPSFGRVLLLLVGAAVPIVLTLVGADYIDPQSSMFDLSYSWPDADAGRYGYWGNRRRAATVNDTTSPSRLQRRVEWGIGDHIPVTVAAPTYSVPYHTWWTSGGRAGLMTNALTPIVVILALKQVPWAVMSTRLFGQHAFERLSFLHKWGGRLLWAFAAAHTIAWSIQLDKDQQFGTNIWNFVFIWVRFRWAFVSLGFLTLLVVLSISPIRKNHYEWFYISHIVCAIGFMVAAALHHPPLAPWMWAALAWWGAERLTRAVKVAYVNGIGFAGRKPQVGGSAGAAAFPEKHGDVGQQHMPYGADVVRGHHHHHDHQQPSPPPAFLEHDPSQPTGDAYPEEDEWELDENGDKIRRRPSRRYGPVVDLLKEYSSRPMSGIEEHSGSESGPSSHAQHTWKPHHSSHASEGIDLGLQGEVKPPQHGQSYDDGPLRSTEGHGSYSSHLPYMSGPSSSADHYTTAEVPAYGSPPTAARRDNHMSYSTTAPSYHSQPVAPPAPHFARSPSHAVALQRQPRPALPADVAALLKPGYAFAQILPGKTLRLTLRTPNRMSWAPGQWVYLNVPAIRGWQSHPFTIASAHDADMPARRYAVVAGNANDGDVEKGLRKESQRRGEERTMVLLLRARKGFTLRLWEHVQQNRHRQLTAAAAGGGSSSGTSTPTGPAAKTTTGVHIRAIVDGAYGSVERVRWGVHSTVIIVCGGSGVSFGISVLEHLCACLKEMNEYGATHRGGKNFAVKKVRFVWVCREFSHLQWIASPLRRCIEMVPPEQLQVDLFVTHLNNQAAMGARPGMGRPGTAGSTGGSYFGASLGGSEGWRDAHGNVYPSDQQQSNDFGNGGPRRHRQHSHDPSALDEETQALQMDGIGLTQFEGEDDEGPTAREMKINAEIRKEGKLRRAHTRKATMKRRGGRHGGGGGGGGEGEGSKVDGPSSSSQQQPRRETQAMLAQRMMFEGNVPARLPPMGSSTDDEGPPQDRRRRRGSRGNGLSGFLSRDPSPSGFGGREPQRTTLYDGPSPHAHLQQRHDDDPPPSMGDDPLSATWNHQQQDQARLTTPSGFRTGTGGSVTPTPGGSFTPSPAMSTTDLPHNGLAYPPTPRSFGSTLGLMNGAAELGRSNDVTITDTDNPIDLDEEEDVDLRTIAELAQFGHPRCDRIIAEEVHDAQGRIIVAACGPSNLATLLRRIVARHIDPAKVRKGDLSAHINLCMESFEWGGA